MPYLRRAHLTFRLIGALADPAFVARPVAPGQPALAQMRPRRRHGGAFSSLSIGVVIFSEDTQAIDSLLKTADQAMYQAKADTTHGVYFAASVD